MNIHFVGIGGIGLSGLARFLRCEGHEVSGSDIAHGCLTKQLEAEGIRITVPHQREAVGKADLVIHSAAIKPCNVELEEARKSGIKVLSRREALPLVLGDKKVYSVCGAHGKSTTSAILASILEESSAIIGAESKQFGSNMRYKPKELMVFEADESDGSFLNSNPYCAIVTNAEPEHMEFYHYDTQAFYGAYTQFLQKAKIRVINAEDTFLKTLDIDAIRLYPSFDIQNIEYILKDDEPYTCFDLRDFGRFEVWGFGEHIAIDASLAILAAMNEVGLDEIKKNIGRFRGIKKRFDIIQKSKTAILIDDYGHHPTEIEATLASVFKYAHLKGVERIITIWQPHKYSRTIDNLQRFTECFEGTQRLIILPVWAAGEPARPIDFATLFKRYNLLIADSIKRAGNKLLVIKDGKVIEEIGQGLVVGFGAGDITYQLRGTL